MKRNRQKKGHAMVAFRLDSALTSRLRELSEKTGISQTRLAENAIRSYLARAVFPPEFPLAKEETVQ